MPRRLALGMAVALVLCACGSGPQRATLGTGPPSVVSSEPTTTTTAPPPVSVVATATVPEVRVFDDPGQAEPSRTLANPSQPYGTTLVFLVLYQPEEYPERIRVLLPVRPNGSSGWINRADVTLETHQFRILVELGAHRLTVWDGHDVFAHEPIGVGTVDTPTPGGVYYTKELLTPVDEAGQPIPDGPYGPFAYGLSGFSDVLYDFAGGDGVIGIHGTNDPSSIGTDASHGCIRLSNEAITRLASTLPIGVPVEISP